MDTNYIYHSVIDTDIITTDIKQVENNDNTHPYNISTITISSKMLNTELNIVNIGKYLEIDNHIIGIKYYYGECSFSKGVYTTTTYKKSKKKKIESVNQVLFYNQISLIILYNERQVNVKLFRNGSLHITGCKSIDDGKYITYLVYEKLLQLRQKTHSILLTTDKYGVLLDYNNFIYSTSSTSNQLKDPVYNIIGFYNTNNNSYIMHNKELIVYNKIKGTFISKNKEQLNLKYICNNNGEIIGHISFLKNKKKCGLHLINEPCYDKAITSNQLNYDYCQIINYSCDPFIKISELSSNSPSPIYDQLIKTTVDCINITITLDGVINRQKLYTYFIDNDYICKYNPQSYSGIKLIYKYPFDDFDGNGLSSNDKNVKLNNDQTKYGVCNCNIKCICLNITFLIFQSGNVIVTGCKNLDQLDNVVYNFKKIINHYYSIKM